VSLLPDEADAVVLRHDEGGDSLRHAHAAKRRAVTHPETLAVDLRKRLEAIAAADDLVGYGPYLDRLSVNVRQRKHPSDNRVESERAAFALDLALKGQRVVVVSSGDPGVFAMASAVLEVACEPAYAGVRP